LADCGCSTGRATYAEQCIQQDWLLLPVPDDITIDEASLACCALGPTFNACQLMNVSATDTVLISGLGAVGLGGVVNAAVRGAKVIGLESHPWRAEQAKRLGAFAVVNPGDDNALEQILSLTDGRGAGKSIEASSAETALPFLVQATRRKGSIATCGWSGQILGRDIISKGLTVHGAWHWNHLRDRDAMWAIIRQARPLLGNLVTHHFPMCDVKSAWELQLTGQCGKIILHPRA
jgi:threonine dehydrogenase-like Zn-dependent dehydrogenase